MSNSTKGARAFGGDFTAGGVEISIAGCTSIVGCTMGTASRSVHGRLRLGLCYKASVSDAFAVIATALKRPGKVDDGTN